MKRIRGFTLMELMIVVAIIAILAMIALPAYSRYAYRARRADGQNLLQHIATAQERYYATYNRYTNDLTQFGYTTPAESEKGYYQASVTLTGAGSQAYTATATPKGAQLGDQCKNLSVNSVGKKDKTGDESNGSCW